MNVDCILQTCNVCGLRYLLIGGMNYLLRHKPVLTFDVDLWVDPAADNLTRCEKALAELEAEWGRTETDWGKVSEKPAGWLKGQGVFCLSSPQGSIDIFLSVAGLRDWSVSRKSAVKARTASGVEYLGLCDADMLSCQMALPSGERKLERIATLKAALGHPSK